MTMTTPDTRLFRRIANVLSLFTFLIIIFVAACSKTGSSPAPTPTPTPKPTPKPDSTVAPPVISQVAPVEGPNATTVTITGTGFNPTASSDTVYFNGKMAKVTSATATQLVVTVPSLAGTGPVAVRINGDSVTGPSFTYDYQYLVSTFAGSTTKGASDGTGAAASFWYPGGLTTDGAGNVYVADSYNSLIRKITPAGVVTTIAGTGSNGSADGVGNMASFNLPNGIVVDASGNLYVADTKNCKIRKITPDGTVSTLAGSGAVGKADGTGAAASFNYPFDLAIDTAGNLYVTDQGNELIRKVTSAGVVTTIAGSGTTGSSDGTGSAAGFSRPTGIAVDASGNCYVADQDNKKIRMITPSGVVTTLAGGTTGSADGTGSAAAFNSPNGMTIDASGTLYVTDIPNQLIRKITAKGVVTTIAGKLGSYGFADGLGTSALFYDPQGIQADAAGNLYVADTYNNSIRKITLQ